MSYDALCDIYSFGIVLLELLSGKQQGKDKVFLQDVILDEDEYDDFAIDSSVSSDWPSECIKELKSLARSCVVKRKKRMPSTTSALRQLIQMKSRYDKPTHMEQGLLDQLRSMTDELSSFRGAREIEIQRSQLTVACLSCMCDYPQIDIVTCSRPTEPHRLCNDCFTHQVISQSKDFVAFTNNGCQIVCSECLALKPTKVVSPFSARAVCSHDDSAVAAYMNARSTFDRMGAESKAKAKEEALERRVEEVRLEGEIKLNQHNEAARLRSVVELHRNRIFWDILMPRCPYCTRSFPDWTNCFAVKCSVEYNHPTRGNLSEGCQNYFCGWCLKGGFRDSNDCHAHVRECELSLNRGNYFGRTNSPISEHNQAQAQIRKTKIERYLTSPDNNLPPQERAAVLEALRDDLRTHGININIDR